MQHNIGMQHPALRIWDGAATYPRDVTRFNYFGFTAEVTGELAADAVFQIRAHDASEADPCVPGPARNVKEVPLCDRNITADTDAQVTIPAGTPVGQFCTFAIPCRPGKFVSIAAVSGDTADVFINLNLSGPQF
jgi:hypothetical protein